MMRQIWYWGFLAAVACALASCVKEKLDYRVTEVEEGLPATVTLKYGVVHNEVVTRAAQQEEYEYRVGNLYVFIFDGQGNKHEGKFFTPGEGLVTDAAARNGSVSFETTTLNHATIVGIANVTIAGQVETAYTITESDLNNIQTLADLKAVVMKMGVASLERNALFMMTGYAKTTGADGQETTDILISAQGTLDCTLQLERTDAKVTFNVRAENTEYSDFLFTPTDWAIHEVPKVCQKAHLLFFTHKAPTFTSWGFVIP